MLRGIVVAGFAGLLVGGGWSIADRERGLPEPHVPGVDTIGYGPEVAGGEVIPKSLEALVREAGTIVLARVIANRCSWDAGHRLIWTDTDLDVEACWKGAASGSVTVREPGGVVEGTGMAVSVAAQYREGDRAVVFLGRDALGQVRTCGSVQGRIPIEGGPGLEGRIRWDLVPASVAAGANSSDGGNGIGTVEDLGRHVAGILSRREGPR